MTLAEDALRLIQQWPAPNEEQAAVRTRFLDLLNTEPEAVRRDHPGAHITASVLIVHADRRQVLLCLHGRMHTWVQVGGHLEDGDATVADAAVREATEETGIPGLRLHAVPIHLDVHPVTCRYGPSYHYDIRFAGIAPSAAAEIVSDESLALGWFTPDALPTPLAPGTAVLIAPALAVFA